VRHLPLLLSHRMHALGDEAVGAAHCASLSAHCARSGIDAQIEAIDSTALQIRLAPPKPAPAVAIIMPTRDGGAHLVTAVTSLFERTDYAHFHLYLVDNGSRDAATLTRLDAWARDPRCTVLRDPAPFNFAAINNRAIAHTVNPCCACSTTISRSARRTGLATSSAPRCTWRRQQARACGTRMVACSMPA
jgi:hypothetical protein